LDASKLINSNSLRSFVALFCAILLCAPPIQGADRKADKLFKEGQKAEADKDYDRALTLYEQAVDLDSQDPVYLLALNRVRPHVLQLHLDLGTKLRASQKLDEAMAEFEKALMADPSSGVALQDIRDTAAMIRERAKRPAGTIILTPAEQQRSEVEKRIASLEGPPQLEPLNNQVNNLRINNQPARVLYETVGKLAGINVLFDPQGFEATPGKNFNLELNNVTLEEALNLVALETHTFWKAVSRNAIFVTQDNDLKRGEYQDEVVKVFYLQNVSAPQDYTEIYNGVRTAANLNAGRGLFAVPSQNAIVVRAAPDTIALVEKIIHDLDRPKAEVVVDVIVMEVDKNKATTIGAALGGQGGLSVPITYAPRSPDSYTSTGSSSTGTGTTGTGTTGTGSTGTTANTYIPLSGIGKVSTGDFATTLPGALLQAMLNDGSTKILDRPQVRATDNGKASLKVGQKIPYVSGSLNSAVATPGSIPYATTQFQQIEVGVDVELQPHVNGPHDISMHVKVEISNVAAEINIAGIQQPEIGQEVDEADIRMKDGEVSLLGGLSDTTNSFTASGIPGVTNIPLLGYLFSTKTRNVTKQDLMIALIPHIVRPPDLSAEAEEAIFAGTEKNPHVRRADDGSPNSPATVPPAAPLPGAQAAPPRPSPVAPAHPNSARP
jgi:general secretion pathway protein D